MMGTLRHWDHGRTLVLGILCVTVICIASQCSVYEPIESSLQSPKYEASIPRVLQGNEIVKFGYPGGHGRLLLKHYYVIMHNDSLRIPEWVAYHLTRENMRGQAPRSNDFRPDPEVPIGKRAELVDYRRSGYHRGHMAPAGDFKTDIVAMSETFYLSNIAPQRAEFNQGPWQKLVNQIRLLALRHGSIWIFTGTLFLDSAGQNTDRTIYIGPNRVAVPTHFYKVVLCQHPDSSREIFAFLMQNRALQGEPKDYMVSVRDLERLTRLDFFSQLPQEEEDSMETTVNRNWVPQ